MENEIILSLNQVRRMPGLYVGTTWHDIYPLIIGFRTAARACGYQLNEQIFVQVVRSHGWRIHDNDIWLPWEYLTRQSTLSPQQILDELLSIEIEAWCLTYNLPMP